MSLTTGELSNFDSVLFSEVIHTCEKVQNENKTREYMIVANSYLYYQQLFIYNNNIINT